jgi:uncharacterized protein
MHRVIHRLTWRFAPASRCVLWLSLALLSAGAGAGQPDLARLRSDAVAGDPWAQLNLGAAYDHGLSGLKADPAEALVWYRRAAEQGVDKAQFNLAHCLASGDGVAQDYQQARVWMEKAARQGMPDAQFLLGVMLVEGLGGAPDAALGRTWLRRAAAGGNSDAADYLREHAAE